MLPVLALHVLSGRVWIPLEKGTCLNGDTPTFCISSGRHSKCSLGLIDHLVCNIPTPALFVSKCVEGEVLLYKSVFSVQISSICLRRQGYVYTLSAYIRKRVKEEETDFGLYACNTYNGLGSAAVCC
jgi:hypothetical protein